MENRLNLLGRKVKIGGDIHTIYAISKPGVFAYIGEEKILDDYGDIAFPVYVTSDEVERNLIDENLMTKDEIVQKVKDIYISINIIRELAESTAKNQMIHELKNAEHLYKRRLMNGEFQ